ncbi:MAG: LD-carboxypeptidase, partial [Cyclobacteriaceae bacterium]|nr:LD-carboxypeptidase [Cyclobacteriaceae bacterium]
RFQKLSVPSIHGPVLVQFGKEEYKSAVEHLLNYLTNKQRYSLTFTVSYTLPDIALEGVITGGNLCMISDSLGTKDEIQTENKMLFIEEVGEDIYRLDRMMTHLSRSGKLSSIKALFVGNLTNIKDTTPSYSLSAKEVILKQVNQYNYPVFFDIPVGHEPPNYALVFGKPVRITYQKKTITITEL